MHIFGLNCAILKERNWNDRSDGSPGLPRTHLVYVFVYVCVINKDFFCYMILSSFPPPSSSPSYANRLNKNKLGGYVYTSNSTSN